MAKNHIQISLDLLSVSYPFRTNWGGGDGGESGRRRRSSVVAAARAAAKAGKEQKSKVPANMSL